MSRINNLGLAIDMASFIDEGEKGHTLGETAEEFGVSKDTIKRNIDFLGSMAFYSTLPPKTRRELQIKYLKAKKRLKSFHARRY